MSFPENPPPSITRMRSDSATNRPHPTQALPPPNLAPTYSSISSSASCPVTPVMASAPYPICSTPSSTAPPSSAPSSPPIVVRAILNANATTPIHNTFATAPEPMPMPMPMSPHLLVPHAVPPMPPPAAFPLSLAPFPAPALLHPKPALSDSGVASPTVYSSPVPYASPTTFPPDVHPYPPADPHSYPVSSAHPYFASAGAFAGTTTAPDTPATTHTAASSTYASSSTSVDAYPSANAASPTNTAFLSFSRDFPPVSAAFPPSPLLPACPASDNPYHSAIEGVQPLPSPTSTGTGAGVGMGAGTVGAGGMDVCVGRVTCSEGGAHVLYSADRDEPRSTGNHRPLLGTGTSMGTPSMSMAISVGDGRRGSLDGPFLVRNTGTGAGTGTGTGVGLLSNYDEDNDAYDNTGGTYGEDGDVDDAFMEEKPRYEDDGNGDDNDGDNFYMDADDNNFCDDNEDNEDEMAEEDEDMGCDDNDDGHDDSSDNSDVNLSRHVDNVYKYTHKSPTRPRTHANPSSSSLTALPHARTHTRVPTRTHVRPSSPSPALPMLPDHASDTAFVPQAFFSPLITPPPPTHARNAPTATTATAGDATRVEGADTACATTTAAPASTATSVASVDARPDAASAAVAHLSPPSLPTTTTTVPVPVPARCATATLQVPSSSPAAPAYPTIFPPPHTAALFPNLPQSQTAQSESQVARSESQAASVHTVSPYLDAQPDPVSVAPVGHVSSPAPSSALPSTLPSSALAVSSCLPTHTNTNTNTNTNTANTAGTASATASKKPSLIVVTRDLPLVVTRTQASHIRTPVQAQAQARTQRDGPGAAVAGDATVKGDGRDGVSSQRSCPENDGNPDFSEVPNPEPNNQSSENPDQVGGEVHYSEDGKWRVEWVNRDEWWGQLRHALVQGDYMRVDDSQSGNSGATKTSSGVTDHPFLSGQDPSRVPESVLWAGLLSLSRVHPPATRAERDEIEELLLSHGALPVFVEPRIRRRYDQFCTSVLLPLAHFGAPQFAHSGGIAGVDDANVAARVDKMLRHDDKNDDDSDASTDDDNDDDGVDPYLAYLEQSDVFASPSSPTANILASTTSSAVTAPATTSTACCSSSPHCSCHLDIDALWSGFQAVTLALSAAIAASSPANDTHVWIHSLHLSLLPASLRAKLPHAYLSLFIHSPFPASEVLRSLPQRAALLRSLLACDLLGVHTYDYARHIVSSARRVLNIHFRSLPSGVLQLSHAGNRTLLAVAPAAIDTQHYQQLPAVSREWSSRWEDKQAVLSFCDFEPLEGAPLRFLSYRRLLALRNDVVFVDVVGGVLSPVLVAAHAHARANRDFWRSSSFWAVLRTITNLAQHIYAQAISAHDAPNASSPLQYYPSLAPSLPPPAALTPYHLQCLTHIVALWYVFGPDVYQPLARRTLSFASLLSLCASCRVGLFLPLWHGLALSPLHYVASQPTADPGVLVLSSLLGCAHSLPQCIRVHPSHAAHICEKVNYALSLSTKARLDRHAEAWAYTMSRPLSLWTRACVTPVVRKEPPSQVIATGLGNLRVVKVRADLCRVNASAVWHAFKHSSHRLIMVDFDGTLVPHNDQTFNYTSPDSFPLRPPEGGSAAGPSGAGTSAGTGVGDGGDSASVGEGSVGTDTSTPTASALYQRAQHLINTLVRIPHTYVFIMSGRRRNVLEALFPADVGLVAEGGVAVRWPQRLAAARAAAGGKLEQGRWEWLCNVHLCSAACVGGVVEVDDTASIGSGSTSHDTATSSSSRAASRATPAVGVVGEGGCWRRQCLSIMRDYAEQTDGAWVYDKECSLEWHFSAADSQFALWQATELSKALVHVVRGQGVRVLTHEQQGVLAVQPVGVSKGASAAFLLNTILGMGHCHECKQRAETALNGDTTAVAAPVVACVAVEPGSAAAMSARHYLTPHAWQWPALTYNAVPLALSHLFPSPASSLSPLSVGLSCPRPTHTQFQRFSPFVLAMGDGRADEYMYHAVDSICRDGVRVRHAHSHVHGHAGGGMGNGMGMGMGMGMGLGAGYTPVPTSHASATTSAFPTTVAGATAGTVLQRAATTVRDGPARDGVRASNADAAQVLVGQGSVPAAPTSAPAQAQAGDAALHTVPIYAAHPTSTAAAAAGVPVSGVSAPGQVSTSATNAAAAHPTRMFAFPSPANTPLPTTAAPIAVPAGVPITTTAHAPVPVPVPAPASLGALPSPTTSDANHASSLSASLLPTLPMVPVVPVAPPARAPVLPLHHTISGAAAGDMQRAVRELQQSRRREALRAERWAQTPATTPHMLAVTTPASLPLHPTGMATATHTPISTPAAAPTLSTAVSRVPARDGLFCPRSTAYVTVTVGLKPTRAHSYIDDEESAGHFLSVLGGLTKVGKSQKSNYAYSYSQKYKSGRQTQMLGQAASSFLPASMPLASAVPLASAMPVAPSVAHPASAFTPAPGTIPTSASTSALAPIYASASAFAPVSSSIPAYGYPSLAGAPTAPTASALAALIPVPVPIPVPVSSMAGSVVSTTSPVPAPRTLAPTHNGAPGQAGETGLRAVRSIQDLTALFQLPS